MNTLSGFVVAAKTGVLSNNTSKILERNVFINESSLQNCDSGCPVKPRPITGKPSARILAAFHWIKSGVILACAAELLRALQNRDPAGWPARRIHHGSAGRGSRAVNRPT